MKAIILAGGKGLRLREVVADLPKPMAPIAGRPFLEYLILQLKRHGMRDVILATGYRSEAIRDHFRDGTAWDMHIAYSQETEPLGTGGALRKAADLIDGNDFLVMNGDSFLDVNLEDLAERHRARGSLGTLSLVRKNDAGRYGSVAIDENGLIHAFTEKGDVAPGLINGGVYCFGRSIVEHIGSGNISLERDVLPGLTGRHLYGFETNGYFVDMGIPADYRDLCDHPESLFSAVGL
jgi:D-glycero-alpha-D-manno-heptose 1-phosphate guanylyltransferase